MRESEYLMTSPRGAVVYERSVAGVGRGEGEGGNMETELNHNDQS